MFEPLYLEPISVLPNRLWVFPFTDGQQKGYTVWYRLFSMPKIELDDEVVERIDRHLEEGETRQEFLDEILGIYESEGAFLQESE